MRNDIIGLGLLVAGVLALLGMRIVNDRNDWILTGARLPLTAGESIAQEFVARTDGYAEIQVEVDASIASNIRDAYVTPINAPSALDLRWEVNSDGHIVAAGDAGEYLYVEGVPSLLGRIRRVVMHIPYGRNAAHWNSLGLAGSRTIARGVGRFPIERGKPYVVNATAHADHADLGSWAPALIVRADRRVWQRHYERVRIVGYSGLALIAAAFAFALLSRLRFSPPPPRT